MEQKPNIILITIDCLRADYCGWLNHEHKDLTPFLNQLAEESIIFTRAYTTGTYTLLAFTGILTGTYTFNFSKPERPYLPKILQNNKYFTIAIHNNPYLSAFYGFNQGFNVFKDLCPIKHKIISRIKVNLKTLKLYNSFKLFIYKKLPKLYNLKNLIAPAKIRQPFSIAQEINNAVLNEVKLAKNPLFLWIHYMDVHAPYCLSLLSKKTITSNFSTEELKQLKLKYKNFLHYNDWSTTNCDLIKKLYRFNIKLLDHQIEILFNKLKRESENSIIVVMADHGEEFGEHGGWGHTRSKENNKLYEEILHIPLIIRMPNKQSGRADKIVSCSQIPATILELAKIKVPSEMEPSLFTKNKVRVYSESISSPFPLDGLNLTTKKIEIKDDF